MPMLLKKTAGDWQHLNPETLELEIPKSKKKFKLQFTNIIDEISKILQLAEKQYNSKSAPIVQPKNFLRRLVYQLGKWVIKNELAAILEAAVIKIIKEKGGKFQRNRKHKIHYRVFLLCFRAISSNKLKLTGGELSRSVQELTEALARNVSHKNLIGDIYQFKRFSPLPQSGGRTGPKKEKSKTKENGKKSPTKKKKGKANANNA